MSAAFQEIIDQHVEEAAFLWLLRSQAVHAPNYAPDDLAELEERIDAHLEGLALAGEDGWQACEAALEFKEAGEVFAASVIAIRSDSEEKLARVLAVVEEVPESGKGMTSALGWHAFGQIKPIADKLLAAESAAHRTVGLATYAIHRVDPGDALDKALVDDDPWLRARACKAAGELGAARTVPTLEKLLSDEDHTCAFWAAWAATLLGSVTGLTRLVEIAKSDSPFAEPALRLAPRRLDMQACDKLVEELAGQANTRRAAILAAGAAGDPAKIPWLIEMMKNPDYARIAGDSFSIITGLDIATECSEIREPADFRSGSAESPEDDDIELDQDGDLPWPSVSSIKEWWSRNGQKLSTGRRFLNGVEICDKRGVESPEAGFQGRREAEALQQAIQDHGGNLRQTSNRASLRKTQKH